MIILRINCAKLVSFEQTTTIEEMSKVLLTIVTCLTMGIVSLQAQQIEGSLGFKSGKVKFSGQSAHTITFNQPAWNSETFKGKVFGIAGFKTVPTQDQLKNLPEGFNLHGYIPEMAYYFSAAIDLQTTSLSELGVETLISIQQAWKVDAHLNSILQDAENHSIWAYYLNEKDKSAYRNYLEENGFEFLEDHYLSGAFELTIAAADLDRLSQIPFIFWIELAPPALELNNWDERTNHRVPAVEPGSGRFDLTGKNVIVGEWDGTGVGTHIDFDFRHVRMEPHTNNSNGAHATHVAGTVLGGGILNPLAKGMAPEARLFSWDFGGNIPVEMDSGASKQKIEITQNSYTYSSDPCSIRGTYDGVSAALDQLVNKYPHLLHVYAAGNSRSNNCMSGGYRTVHSGFQSSKNALVVAAVTHLDANSSFHSYGPTIDGRLKPDVSAVGVNVYSTAHNHTYLGGYSGTSMACPGTSGTSALIYELYKKKYGNQPASHIIKGIMCNAADDIGRPGPDYMYGFGRINARAAAEMLDDNRFITGTLMQTARSSDTIFVPKNSHALKVLLCWDDVPATSSVGKSLVNDLDLVLFDSAGNQILPWILDPVSPTTNAVRGVDTLNNTEQVTISKPTSPYYIYRVTGTKIPSGVENFSLSWNIQDTGITVTYPNGDEKWVPPSSAANAQIIRWDNRGISGNVKIEYSINGGSTWNNVVNATPAANLYYVWQTCPDTVITSKALIRISAPGVSDQSDTFFHIMKIPASPNGVVCDSQVHLSWTALSGAIAYGVFVHDSGVMKLVGTTNLTEFTVRNLSNNVPYWFAINAIGKDGARSERCQARTFTPLATTKAPDYVLEPADMRICLGSDTAVLVALTGTPIITSYWQYSDNKGASWTKIGLDNQLLLKITNPGMSQNNRWFRHYAVNACQSKEYSRVAVLNIDSNFSFRYHAPEVKACIGQDTAIVLQYKSSNTPLFQWYFQKSLTDPLIPVAGLADRLLLKNNQKSNQGYYKVMMQNACGSVQNSAPVFLRVRDQLALSLPAEDTICQGNAYMLQVGASGGDTANYRFQWTSTEGMYTGNKVSVQPVKTNQWEVSVFDGCSQDTVKSNYTLFVRDSLRLNLSADTTVCSGTLVNLNAAVSGGLASGYTYIWSEGLSNQPNHQFVPESSKTYYVTITDNCTQYMVSDSVHVAVLEALNVKITSNMDTLCVGQTAKLTANATGGISSNYEFRWSDNSSGNSILVNPTSTQFYSVQLRDYCTVLSDADTFILPVRLPLAADIIGKDTTCFNVNTAFRAEVSGGKSDAVQYFWQQMAGTSAYDVYPKKSFRLLLRVNDGCTVLEALDSMEVYVYDSLAANAAFADSLVCYGQTIFLPIAPRGGRANHYTASWSNGANTITGIQTVNTTDKNYRVTISDGCSLPAFHDFNIKTRPALEVNAGADIRLCDQVEVRIPIVISGGLSSAYELRVNGQIVNPNDDIVYRGNAGDSARFDIQLSDGCTVPDGVDNLQVSVDDVNPDFSVARVYDKELTLISPFTPHDALYRFGDGFSHSGNETRVVHNFNDYGIYSVCRFTSSDIGCRDTFCREINVYNVFESSGFEITLSPNPTGGKVWANFDKIAGNLRIEIWDAQGKLISSKSVQNYLEEKVEIDLSPFAPAMYWVRIISNEEIQTFKVIRD